MSIYILSICLNWPWTHKTLCRRV